MKPCTWCRCSFFLFREPEIPEILKLFFWDPSLGLPNPSMRKLFNSFMPIGGVGLGLIVIMFY